jgi:hypothetical protein
MTRQGTAIVFRLVLAAASLFAVGYQLFALHIPNGDSVVNFFVYFTNLSNIIISVVFIVSAIRLIRGRNDPSPIQTAVRGGAVVYIAFVGIVFNTLLRDVSLGDLEPWVNVVLHFVLPIAGVVDWILWPPRNRLPARTILWWMIFPAVYAIFSIVRGALGGFYPYPFFNPGAVGGYGAVALYCLVMIVAFLVLAFAVRALGNWRQAAAVQARTR